MKNIIGSLFRLIPKIDKESCTVSWYDIMKNETELWNRSKQIGNKGQSVLVATGTGCFDHAVHLESSLAVALTLRGARVEILLCDEFLPCCMMTKTWNVLPDALLGQETTPRCPDCFRKGKENFEPQGLPIHRYSQFVSGRDVLQSENVSQDIPLEEIVNYQFDGLAVGVHALAGALRYYARGDLDGEPFGERILRRYLKASLLTVYSVQELLNQNHYDVAIFHHGIYVPQGLVGEVCRKNGVRVVNWNPSYRKQTFIFSHDDSYHHTMISEPTSEWEDIQWTEGNRNDTLEYLKSRWYGTEDWIWFHEKPMEDVNKIAEELDVDFQKPCIGMLTSVIWDAQLHYKSNAFNNMLDWVFKTIEYFAERPELQLLIRVHPAEVRGMIPSRQKLADEIRKTFSELPGNIFVIPPESQTSTYAVMEKCDSVIIYNTKTGIEIASMGIPVIVAGEAWIRNKGFSIDACSPDDYFAILDRLPLQERLSDEMLERAQKYAFHYFFRRMIKLPFIVSHKKYKFDLNLASINELLPGEYPGLDVICKGILGNQSFVVDSR